MVIAVADTHTLLWYLSGDPRLSSVVDTFIQNADRDQQTVGVSSISLIEIVYLVEKGRIPSVNFTELARMLTERTSVFVELPLDLQIARTMAKVDVTQVPDMPDRIIAATALHYGVPVLSKDRKIRLANLSSIW